MPRLPNAAQAIVDPAKISDYLLNGSHARGAAKARFLMRFGFAPNRPEELRRALLAHARENDVTASHWTDFGAMFEIEGALPSPDGRDPLVRTVWMLDDGMSAPRLITMVPRSEGRGGEPV